MNRSDALKFVGSQGKLTDGRNRAFLKGECDFIAGQFERKVFSLFLPTFFAVSVYAVLSYKTPFWFSIPIALAVWLIFFSTEMENNRKLARLTPTATLLAGEVTSVKESETGDYGDNNCKLTIVFQIPDGQTIEKSTEGGSRPESWNIGDQVVVLFADNDNFWVL